MQLRNGIAASANDGTITKSRTEAASLRARFM
jgi:hypothetical protein